METKKIVMPIVHLNGTAAEDLISQRSEFLDGLHLAGRCLAKIAPNGRDYYLEPGRMEKAVEQHERRMAALKEMIEEIEGEVRYLDELDR